MVEFDRGYGPTQAELIQFTNRRITNTAEFERQRARAQEVFDALCGIWVPFHIDGRSISLGDLTAESFTSNDLSVTQDDYYNNLELRIVQGDGKGFRGYISGYTSSDGVVTVSGVSPDVSFSATSASDTAVLTQIAQFPRLNDIDVTGRPRNPEGLSRIIAYIMEYWVNLEDQKGFNADEMANLQADVIQEGLGAWQTTFKADRNINIQLIGPKAYELAVRQGYIRRTARLVKFSRTPTSRRFI